MSERVLPHSLDVEKALLGGVLVNGDLFKVVPNLTAGMFFRAAHGRIWEKCQRLSDRNQPIDFMTVRLELERANELESIGGAGYLAELTTGATRSANVEYFAAEIRDKATLRRLISAGTRIVDDAYAQVDDVDDLLDQSEARLMDVGRSASKGDFVSAADWMGEMVPVFQTAVDEKRVVTGVATGLDSLDRITRGLQPGDLVIIAARPSTGKTALAWQIAAWASRDVVTAFVSLEMSRASVGWRAIALESRIDAFRLMTGRIGGREVTAAADALNRVAERHLFIDDVSGQTASAVSAKIRRLAARQPVGLALVDYAQLMTSGERSENRTLDVGAITRRMKTLARDLEMPLVLLSQLTRDNERENRRPRLSDLREGGSLEQDADVVIFLHRPNAKEKRFEANETIELILAKQRMGPVSVLEMRWDAPTMRFADPVESSSEPVQERLA